MNYKLEVIKKNKSRGLMFYLANQNMSGLANSFVPSFLAFLCVGVQICAVSSSLLLSAANSFRQRPTSSGLNAVSSMFDRLIWLHLDLCLFGSFSSKLLI